MSPWKRVVDIALSAAALVMLSPLLLLLAGLVRTKLGRPIFFTQRRPGLHGEVFRLYKFRSMSNERDAAGHLLPDEIRLGRLGWALRSTSVDELPALWNVLRGDMSLVGPRPLLVEYLELYSPEQARRHNVRPGITGWAQVNGRNAVSWDRKFELDLWYVDHQSLLLDIRILFMTVAKVVARKDINGDHAISMQRFSGNEQQSPPSQ